MKIKEFVEKEYWNELKKIGSSGRLTEIGLSVCSSPYLGFLVSSPYKLVWLDDFDNKSTAFEYGVSC